MPTLEDETGAPSNVDYGRRDCPSLSLSLFLPLTRGTFACSLADNCSPTTRHFHRQGRYVVRINCQGNMSEQQAPKSVIKQLSLRGEPAT